MAGFIILDVILINLGDKGAGILGLALLPLIPIYYAALSYAEKTGRLPRVASDDAGVVQVRQGDQMKGEL